MTALQLADRETVADLTTYVTRARALDTDGAIRLQASGTTLAAWVGVLRGRGITGQGTVVGLRALELAEPAEVDSVVPLPAVSDRLARIADDDTALDVPPMTVRTSWAAVSPPRAGWHPIAEIDIKLLSTVAAEGISQIAQGAPEGSGAVAVETLRQEVWGQAMPLTGAADGLPAGVAFGAYALGFLTGEVAQVYTAARWFRVTTLGGHVLVR
ncbi:hypothetical protein [Luteipulveratus mongoliensis]|uniref:Uncharacterized protein n=1 Tax=Luteipulveratus mongoliensis TaxID=571913 RepID=A0A0K1JL07_9MICO|nr:hypothetical protein [Luteipulveratus mongoliensis]AKU17396.1 hypothetical protein VV02_18640 [Luteipulveratus mongoliensis]